MEVDVVRSDVVSVQAGSSFAWAPVPSYSNQDPRAANDIIDQRIRRAVEQALTEKGYRQISDPASAALTVAYYVAVDERQETRIDSWGGASSRWGVYGAPQFSAHTDTYTEGALILDLTDRASGRLAWRAASRKKLHTGDGAQDAITETLRTMTASLPSQAR